MNAIVNRLHLTMGRPASSGCNDKGDRATGDAVRLPEDWTGERDSVETAAVAAATAAAACLLANLLPSGRRSFLMTAGPLSPSLIRW